jgi:hypothetical protein
LVDVLTLQRLTGVTWIDVDRQCVRLSEKRVQQPALVRGNLGRRIRRDQSTPYVAFAFDSL